jgi:Tol biopolymer transport system component
MLRVALEEASMQTKTLALIFAIAGTAFAQTPNVQFRAAQQKETVDGDLTAAIKLYRQVADAKSTPSALAASALVRLGHCYERLGSTEAAKAYERVVTQFGKEEAATEARQRLASLPGKGGSSAPESSLVTRRVAGDLPWIQNTLTRDGRYTLVRPGLGLDLFDLVTGSRKPIRGGAPLVSQTEYSRGPYVISPNGRQFAFWVATPGHGDLRVAHIDGSGIRTLASLPGKLKIQPLDWSDDGHTILAAPFSRDGTSNEFLFVDTSGQTTRSIRVSGNIGGQARYSPDKQWIVFEKVLNGKTSLDELRRGDLFMIRVDGSVERQLVQWEEAVSLAGWSPDGGSVLFVSRHLGTDHLWGVPVKDGAAASAPVSVMKGFSPVRVMGMTPQGVLLYSTGSWGTQPIIARLDGPGGTPTMAHPEKSQGRMFGLSPTWSPDGRYLAYEFREVDDGTGPTLPSVVIVRDLVSGKEREVGRFLGFHRRLSWTPDSKSVLVPVSAPDGSNVLRLDIASGKSEPLIPAKLLDSQSVPSFPQLSPDGKYLYYLQSVPPALAARLMRLDLAQAQAQQLATVQQLYAMSPSGNEFVAPVADEASGTMILRLIGAKGETLRDLITVNAPEALTSADWSPDGQNVYFARTLGGNQSGLFRIPTTGGNSVPLGVRGVAYPDFRIHPNGKEIAFVIIDQQMEIWRLEGLSQAVARALQSPRKQAARRGENR